MFIQKDLEDLCTWIHNREQSGIRLKADIEQAIQVDDSSGFVAIVLGYAAWRDRVNQFAKELLRHAAACNHSSWSLDDAVTYFRAVYDLLEVDRKWMIGHPVFPQMIIRLQEGAADSSAIGGLLHALTARIERPPDLRWLREPLFQMRAYDGTPLEFLAEYETLRQRVWRIWSRYKRSPAARRDTALRQAFPCLSHRAPYQDNPEHIALEIIAPQGGNVFDLRRDRARAKKIQKILVIIFGHATPSLPGRFAVYLRVRHRTREVRHPTIENELEGW